MQIKALSHIGQNPRAANHGALDARQTARLAAFGNHDHQGRSSADIQTGGE